MRHPLILSIAIAGALAVGCSRPARPAADLVITGANVWTGNPDDVFSIPAARLKEVQVLTTIAGGTIVHQRRP